MLTNGSAFAGIMQDILLAGGRAVVVGDNQALNPAMEYAPPDPDGSSSLGFTFGSYATGIHPSKTTTLLICTQVIQEV